jgi:hypothetical protein
VSVGGTFGATVNTNLPSGFKTSLSYDAGHAYLDLALLFIAPPTSGLGRNQSNVGNALINYFNSNGGIPLVYGGLTLRYQRVLPLAATFEGEFSDVTRSYAGKGTVRYAW